MLDPLSSTARLLAWATGVTRVWTRCRRRCDEWQEGQHTSSDPAVVQLMPFPRLCSPISVLVGESSLPVSHHPRTARFGSQEGSSFVDQATLFWTDSSLVVKRVRLDFSECHCAGRGSARPPLPRVLHVAGRARRPLLGNPPGWGLCQTHMEAVRTRLSSVSLSNLDVGPRQHDHPCGAADPRPAVEGAHLHRQVLIGHKRTATAAWLWWRQPLHSVCQNCASDLFTG